MWLEMVGDDVNMLKRDANYLQGKTYQAHMGAPGTFSTYPR